MTLRKTISIIIAVIILGILIGVAWADYSSSLLTGHNYQASTIYGYELSAAMYDQKILSPVGVNEFENVQSGSFNFVFTSTPSLLVVTYCEVQILTVKGELRTSACLDTPSNLNTILESAQSGYEYDTPSIFLPTGGYNSSGIQANVTYTSNGGTSRYSYLLFSNNRISVSVGQYPEYAAFDSNNGNLYVTNFESDTVSEISNSSDKVIATLGGFSGPFAIAYDPIYNDLYVSNFIASSVSVINASTNTLAHNPIRVGDYPYAIVYDPVNHNVYVTCNESNSVVEISAKNNTVATTILGFNLPEGIAYDYGNGDLYVANSGNSSVSIFNPVTNLPIANVKVDASPVSMAYDRSNGDIFVGTASSVDVINVSEDIAARIPFAVGGPIALAFDPTNGDMYLAETSLTEVLMYDANLGQVGTILFGAPASSLTYDLANTRMYVVHPTGNNVVGVLPSETSG